MLVLTRKRGEEVVISVPPSAAETRITVRTSECRPDKVRLGFEAPRDVQINRAEVQDEIDRGALR